MERRTFALLSAGLLCASVAFALAACGPKEAEKEKTVETEDEADGASAKGVPKIVAVKDTFDFGKVKQGAAVEHVFKIKNEGKADLKIEKARGS